MLILDWIRLCGGNWTLHEDMYPVLLAQACGTDVSKSKSFRLQHFTGVSDVTVVFRESAGHKRWQHFELSE